MKRKTLLEELLDYSTNEDEKKNRIVEEQATHIITSAINFLESLPKNYTEEQCKDLEKRFLLAIKNKKMDRFEKGMRKLENGDQNV